MTNFLNSIKQFFSTLSKYRLKREYRKKFRIIFITFFALLFVSFIYAPFANYYHSVVNPPKTVGRVKVDWYKDYNAEHLKYAKRLGIKPFKKNKDFHEGLPELLKEGKLKKVKNNSYYSVQHLTHSHPYLTPNTIKLLEDIGKRFQKKLDENDLGNYRYQISSLLRTEESQKSLSKSNRNATTNTSHLYGTTFDIPYKKVIKKPLPWVKVEVADARAIKLLSEAIGDLRKEGRCLVVTERLETCFHITVMH